MTMLNTKRRTFSASSAAASRQQKLDAHYEAEERSKQFKPFMFQGFGFRPYVHARNGSIGMEGPLCPRQINKDRLCFAKLSGTSTEATEASCEVCGGTYTLPFPFQKFREVAHKALDGKEAFEAAGGEIQTLDTPFENIKERSEQETRAIEVKWSQKDGRNMAVIYFINRESGEDKTQVFIDMDREEVRYDASNTAPKKTIAEITAVFRDTKAKIEYTKANE